MGLLGSKQTKNVVVKNPDAAEIYVTEGAFDNILKSTQPAVEEAKQPPVLNEPTPAAPIEVKVNLSAGLNDKRLVDYENAMIAKFDSTTRDVENLFNDRLIQIFFSWIGKLVLIGFHFKRYTQLPVCMDLQKQVSACYTEYPNKPLNCLDIAHQFIKCVEDERKKQLGNAFLKPIRGV